VKALHQLRETCQYKPRDDPSPDDWLTHIIVRRFSIYLTVLFLKVGLSANKVTALRLLPCIGAGVLLAFPQPEYWLLAWGLLFVWEILDCCDGEIARYSGTPSLVGEYNDTMADVFCYRFLRVCMCFGIYAALRNSVVFVLGFAQVIGWIVFWVSPPVCQGILYRAGFRRQEFASTKPTDSSPAPLRRALRLGRALVDHTGFFFALPVTSILDMLVPPFSVASVNLDFRFMYLVLLALALLFGAVLGTHDINKHGVRLHGW
jgi:hypothetical protein